jgi:hypothetical protein
LLGLIQGFANEIETCRQREWTLIGHLAAKLFTWRAEASGVIVGPADVGRALDASRIQTRLNRAFVRLVCVRVLDSAVQGNANNAAELKALAALVAHVPDSSILHQIASHVGRGVWSRGAKCAVDVLLFLSMLAGQVVEAAGRDEDGRDGGRPVGTGADGGGGCDSDSGRHIGFVIVWLQARFRFAIDHGCIGDPVLESHVQSALCRTTDPVLGTDPHGKRNLPPLSLWLQWEREGALAMGASSKFSVLHERADVHVGDIRCDGFGVGTGSSTSDPFPWDEQPLFASTQMHAEWLIYAFNTWYAAATGPTEAAKLILVELCSEVHTHTHARHVQRAPHLSRWRIVDVPAFNCAGLVDLLRHCVDGIQGQSTSSFWVLEALHQMFKLHECDALHSAVLADRAARDNTLDNVVRVVLRVIDTLACLPRNLGSNSVVAECESSPDHDSCRRAVFRVLGSAELRPWPANVLALCKRLAGCCDEAKALIDEDEHVARDRWATLD